MSGCRSLPDDGEPRTDCDRLPVDDGRTVPGRADDTLALGAPSDPSNRLRSVDREAPFVRRLGTL